MSRQTTLGRFGFKNSISHRNSVMETKVPDFVSTMSSQGQLNVINAVNSLLTSKGCLYMRNVCMVYLQMFQRTKLDISFSKSQPRLYS